MNLEQKLNEMAEKQVIKPDNSIGYCIECYKDGAKDILDLPEVKRLYIKSATISAWLRRMSDLQWDDKGYAPNFKKAHADLEEVLNAWNTFCGEGETK